MRNLTIVIHIVSVAFLMSCQGQSFDSGNKKSDSASAPGEANGTSKPEVNANAEAQPQATSDSQPGEPSVEQAAQILQADGSLSPEDNKILGCLKEWGKTGLSQEGIKSYKTLTTSSEGFSAGSIQDLKESKEPQLALVKASSTGFAGAKIELLNPQGWYCLDLSNVGFSSTQVSMHCKAEQAGLNQVNKGFSSTQIQRVGCSS